LKAKAETIQTYSTVFINVVSFNIVY